MRTPKNWSRVSPGNLTRVSNLWPATGGFRTCVWPTHRNRESNETIHFPISMVKRVHGSWKLEVSVM
jgi:hypothetical protein